jgi:membrane-associated phospholipid phosphatase
MTKPFFAWSTPSRRWFFAGATAYLTVAAVWVATLSKANAFQMLRAFHPAWLSWFLRGLTHLGDGIFALLLMLALWLWRAQAAIAFMLAVAYAVSGLLSQSLKNTIGADRPARYFSKLGLYMYQVPGVSLHSLHSFPSGHTITAFALASLVALHYRQWWVGGAAALLAAGVGYSRVYLGQHFPADVLAGACIGLASGTLTYFALGSWAVHRWPPKS